MSALLRAYMRDVNGQRDPREVTDLELIDWAFAQLGRCYRCEHSDRGLPCQAPCITGDTTCDACGDRSNSEPGLRCGRVEPASWVGPCQGVYWPVGV